MIDREYVPESIKIFCGQPPYMVQIDCEPPVFGGYFDTRKGATDFIWAILESMSRNCPNKRLPDAHVFYGDYIGCLSIMQEDK